MTRTNPRLAISTVVGALGALIIVAPSVMAATTTTDDSLTDAGAEMFGDLLDDGQLPDYDLSVSVDTDTGEVDGSMSLVLADAPADRLTFRWFPNLDDFNADARLDDVSIDGVTVEPTVDDTIITLDRPPSNADEPVVVEMTFSYTVPETDTDADPLGSMNGDGLDLGSIGLLGRTDTSMALGHWFPVWLPPSVSAEPQPDGYGDIGNFPAADMRAEITAPGDAAVVSGGVRVSEPAVGTAGDTVTVVDAASGVRDLSIVVLESAEITERQVGDVVVRVYAEPGDPSADEVLDEAAVSVEVLDEAFGGYPWRELDVLAVPLGSGVGGMEWPGMIWIEPTIFGGGVPGMGDLGGGGDFGGLGDMGDIFDLMGPLLGADIGLVIETTRPWTVAHEVGHMWWHAVVGNDSVVDPVVDEPLAQYAACLVMREMRPGDGDDVCRAQTLGSYAQMRSMLGVDDAVADQPTDAFDSSLQYGAVVYGKAPGFYWALEERYGIDETVAALAEVVERHGFEQIDGDELAAALGTALDDPEGVTELWEHWMIETNGDADIGVSASTGGGLGDLGGLGDIGGLLDDLLGSNGGSGDVPGAPGAGGGLDDLFDDLLGSDDVTRRGGDVASPALPDLGALFDLIFGQLDLGAGGPASETPATPGLGELLDQVLGGLDARSGG